MSQNIHRYQDSQRQGETKLVSMVKQNLFSNYYNLPLVHSVKQQASPTKLCLKIKPAPFVAENFVRSEIFDHEDNSSQLKFSILKNSQQQDVFRVPRLNQSKRDDINNKEKQEHYYRAHTIPERIEIREVNQQKEQDKNTFRNNNRSVSRRQRYNSIQLTDIQKLNYTVDGPIHEINNESFEINIHELLPQDTQPPKDKSTLRRATIIMEHQQPLIEIEKLFKRENYRRPQQNSKQYKKLRLIFIFTRAVMRISQKIRQEKKKQLLQYETVLKLREPHFKHVSMYGLKNIKGEHLKYIQMVSNKMLHYFMEKKYILECKQIWDKKNDFEKDLRRTRLCAFSQMFLQNLELLTRGDNLPILIKHQLNNCQFKTKDMQISQFVSKRSQIYSKKITTLTSKEKVLIASEFFVYQVVIPNLLQLVNDIDNTCAAHQNQTMFYCFGLSSMMQILFTNYFSNMKQIQKTNIIPIQRRVTVQTSEQNGIMNALIEIDTKLEQDETQILSGCFQRGSIVDIFYQKPEWNDRMKRLFQQLVSNLQCQIQI